MSSASWYVKNTYLESKLPDPIPDGYPYPYEEYC